MQFPTNAKLFHSLLQKDRYIGDDMNDTKQRIKPRYFRFLDSA